MLAILFLLLVPAGLGSEVAAEDVELSTTFLTFFKNGGGYIEYRISGPAAAELRTRIDDPGVVFPFETMAADGDGAIDQSEGERYMKNLDDILTRRQIILRGVKMDNVDVDEHRGLIGSGINDTDELYLHITFRGHIQYDELEFNVSGLEPLEVLYGSYSDIPSSLTVDERTSIVAVGFGSYQKVLKEEGSLLNMRIPLGAVIRFHHSYTVGSAPTVRMMYDHSTILDNPLILMLLMILSSYLTIKLPKGVAKENGMDRVPQLHQANLAMVIVVWLIYVFGAAAFYVWFLAALSLALAYYFAHMVYKKGWRGIAQSEEGIDLGDAILAADPVNGGSAGQMYSPNATFNAPASTAPATDPEDEVVVLLAQDTPHQVPQPVAHSTITRVDAPPVPPAEQAPPVAPVVVQHPAAQAVQAAAPAQSAPVVVQHPAAAAAQAANSNNGSTKRMKCQCDGFFDVPLIPRPLEVECPHCGTTGVLR
jgi:hypothetical protein